MAITCDYCGEPITDTLATQLGVVGSTTMPTPARFDVHPECMPEFIDKVTRLRGKRGQRQSQQPPPVTP